MGYNNAKLSLMAFLSETFFLSFFQMSAINHIYMQVMAEVKCLHSGSERAGVKTIVSTLFSIPRIVFYGRAQLLVYCVHGLLSLQEMS